MKFHFNRNYTSDFFKYSLYCTVQNVQFFFVFPFLLFNIRNRDSIAMGDLLVVLLLQLFRLQSFPDESQLSRSKTYEINLFIERLDIFGLKLSNCGLKGSHFYCGTHHKSSVQNTCFFVYFIYGEYYIYYMYNKNSKQLKEFL